MGSMGSFHLLQSIKYSFTRGNHCFLFYGRTNFPFMLPWPFDSSSFAYIPITGTFGLHVAIKLATSSYATSSTTHSEIERVGEKEDGEGERHAFAYSSAWDMSCY